MSRYTTLHCGRLVFALLVSLWFLYPLLVYAQDYQGAYTAIENLSAEIRMSEGVVGQTLAEALKGKHGEIEKWTVLDEKMTALGQTIDRNLSEIGRNATTLFAGNPDVSLPRVALGRVFEGNLKMATDKRNGLSNLGKAEYQKLSTININLAKLQELRDNAILDATGEYMSVMNPLPGDLLEAEEEFTIVLLAGYTTPVGALVVSVATISKMAISTVISWYYNAKSLKDFMLACDQIRDLLLIKKKHHEENLVRLNALEKEMQQIEEILKKQEKRMEEYKARIDAAVDGWNEKSKNAFKDKTKKLDEKAQTIAAQPKPEIKVSSWAYGMDTIPPIAPAEYGGEVDSMIAQMRSYTQAVEDGGDPDNFQIMVTDWHNRLNDRHAKARQEYDGKYKSYGKASETWNKAMNAARQEYSRALIALQPVCEGLRRNCWPEWDALRARFDAAEKSAYEGLRPFGKALVSPYREWMKLNQINNRVREAYDPFRQRVDNATKAHTRDFWNEFRLWEARMNEANIKIADAGAGVPFWIDQWKDRAAKLDGEIQESLKSGGSIVGIKSGLLATSDQLKGLNKTVREAAKKYAEANSERMRISNLAQTELTSITNRYGRLINYHWASNFSMNPLGSPMEFIPHAPDQEKNMAAISEQIRKTFTIYESESLKTALKQDILGIAAIYENKANELTFYTDWIDTYRNRLSTAFGTLNRISIEKVNQGFYAGRGGDAREVLRKEFSEPPWSSIVQDVDKCVSPEDYATLPQAKFQPRESLSLWQKLYAGQNILLAKLDKEARWYIQIRSGGGFMPVKPTIMKPLEEGWKNLRQVCERYDALAIPMQAKIGNGREEVPKAGQPVFDTYARMPGPSRSIIQGEHNQFLAAFNFLNTYLGNKWDALKPCLQPPTNSIALQLDNLILAYAPRLAKWQIEQKEVQHQYEVTKKQTEAEAQKKAEEERRSVEETQKQSGENLALVKDLYAGFKSAYEGRNDALLISFISSEWQAGDGSTLSALQTNLRRSFRMFDEIKYNMQNLVVTLVEAGRYNVSYDVTITSKIYKRNLKHEEKSTINEEVTIGSSGKAKISKTLGGQFWYTQ